MTAHVFERQMDRLMGLRFPPSTLETHWEGLRGLPEAVLEAAVTRALHTRSEFPTPIELRTDADAVRHLVDPLPPAPDRGTDNPTPTHFLLKNDYAAVAATITVTRTWRYYCEVCGDEGVRSFWCGAGKRQAWIPDADCDSDKCRQIRRGTQPYGHEWVRRCECWESNPAVQRRLAEQAKYATSSGKKVSA